MERVGRIRVKEKQFYEACNIILDNQDNNTGIGTLGEKTLHAIFKYYFEPDSTYHEIRYQGFVADILHGQDVIEIQTRGFNKLRRKLDAFLQEGKVQIVYPIPYEKWLEWIDEETGAISSKRKSPKKGSIYDSFYELYKIKHYLNNPNLKITLVFVNIEEQRLLNGWSHDKKKGSQRFERIPTKLVDQVDINGVEDYTKFLPETLPEVFSTKDYQKATKLTITRARTGVHILHYLGVVEPVGKKGNAILYKRVQ